MNPIIVWDMPDDPDGNVVHIAEHGITQDEVEEVLCNTSNDTVPSDSSGRPATFGWTTTGKFIIVVWERVWDEPRMIQPFTAYEVKPPSSDRSKKRRK